MRLLTLLLEFLEDLRRQKLRSALTILGITWGTVAVVALLAFGAGLETQMMINARGIGESVVILTPGRTTMSFEGFPEGRSIPLEEADVGSLRTEVDGIVRISPEYAAWRPVRRGRVNANPYVTGVYPEYSEIRNVLAADGGRFIGDHDMDGRRRVAFLGNEIARLLFGEEDPIGETIQLQGTPFTVVGVMRKKGQNSSYNARDQDRIFIPSTTYVSMFGDQRVQRILYQPVDPLGAEEVRGEVARVLGARHRFDPTDRDAVYVWDTGENLKMMTYLFLAFNLFLGVVGSFTLIVGGIGVANIMYIVVRERTREIGIRRALGARRSDILLQILVETGLIVAIGAALGLLISMGLVEVAGRLPIQEQVGVPVISPAIVTITISLLSLVAFLAGVFPARKAASLDPVESLRYGV